MNRLKTNLFLLLSYFLLFSCSEDLENPDPDSFDKEKMDLLFSTLEEKDLGMGSISIFQDGEEVYQASFGLADISNSMDNSRETRFRIGSISKTFTAAMIMQLVDEESLSLSTTLDGFFPELPNSGSITIEHMLRHRSGLFNFTSSQDYVTWMTEPKTQEELIEIFVSNGTVFEPDQRAEYSNTNYVLLSFIIESVEGKNFSDVLIDRIISPLNLIRTNYGDNINTANNEALSYYFQNDQWMLAPETDMSIPQGAGAIVSTPSDINTFFFALFNDQVVSHESLNEMQNLVDNYGIGMFQVPFYERSGFAHTGGIDGFQSMSVHFPNDQMTMSYTSNGVSMPMNDVLIGALSIYFGIEYALP